MTAEDKPMWQLVLMGLGLMVVIPILLILLPIAWLYSKVFQP
jgi:uncharacterized membrane protein YdbT with pleckstrin-like domain